jgi:hypothetical protein
MLAEDIVKIRYQEMTSEDIEGFIYAAVKWSVECVIQWGCYSYLYLRVVWMRWSVWRRTDNISRLKSMWFLSLRELKKQSVFE